MSNWADWAGGDFAESFRRDIGQRMAASSKHANLTGDNLASLARADATDIAPMLREMIEQGKKLPVIPQGILASHDVPWGRTFRQWDTLGRLWIWVNRPWLMDAVGPNVRQSDDPMDLLTGLPVYWA